MEVIKKQVKIRAPAKKIMEFISNPKNMEIVIPNVIRNYNISKRKPGPGFTFDWEFSMAGIPFRGKWKILEYNLPKKYVAVSEGMIKSRWTYFFTERASITTWQLSINYEPPKKALGKLTKNILIKMNERDADTFMQNVKNILEK